MRYISFPLCFCTLALLATSATLRAADVERLPELPASIAASPTDWLIDDSPYKADVYRTGHPHEIALDNGLVRRTFRIAPNGATVGLDNFITGQAILRGVKPEAIVTINGVRYEVGGLTGQPNYAYLLPEWLEQVRAAPDAFQFVGLHVGQPAERFAWKRVRHHAPDATWPPNGVYLRMDYAAPLTSPLGPDGPQGSGDGRTTLIADDFKTLDAAWAVHVSDSHERSSFVNEGKVGEIYTPANTAVYVERNLPEGTRLVETTIDVGTDRSASWGPGLTLVFKSSTVKFYIRPGGDAGSEKPYLGAFDGRSEHLRLGDAQPLDISRPWSLRMRLEDGVLLLEAKPIDGMWRTVHTVDATVLGEPSAVRLGKLDRTGGGSDFGGEKGELVRLRAMNFAAYGEMGKEALAERAAKVMEAERVRVSVHYELYDGVPVMSKWITVHNPTDEKITVDRLTGELLAVVEDSNWVEKREGVPLPRPQSLHLETDMAFGGFQSANSNRHVVHWRSDPQFQTQVNYRRETPCLLVVEPTYGPAQDIEPGATFESFRTFELVYDSTERERRGLSLRRMYRTIAPWVTENPLMMHMRTADPDAVRAAIDQCAEVGFEMLILSFGSGFNIENDSPEYIELCKGLADYARQKGIEIGGYSLLASRRVGGGNDVVSPPGTSPTFGNCPALTSEWGQDYFRKLYDFFGKTGFTLLEHDGSYPGDLDVTSRPPLQKGLDDSQWVQWRIISDFYKWCRANGVYLNVPDYYYLAGSSKCGMGYRETNWSLPRAQQVIHTRQNIFDGTWTKTPSMGWMFVPLTQYHGGGAAATIEPLDQHRDHYERMLASNLGMGVQACYRGPRLYDTDRTQTLVKTWVDWFNEYRDILESDVVHGRRADGRDLDWMLHVNPKLNQKGLLVAFNPLKEPVKKTIRVNLYYTGLTDKAEVRDREGEAETYRLNRDYSIEIPVEIAPEGFTWFVME
ncbi:MAG: hypothetical protein ISR77_37795 [Pirellulaceae bacterium]|nr:hypothetical protein [Pirellulaceae bacterium]